MLKIKNLSTTIDSTEIIKDINLEIKAGEIHAIMGPKQSGKSTLAHAIQGNPYIPIDEGSIVFNKKNITRLSADKRAKLGIFTSFQHPPEISGLNNFSAIKMMLKVNKDITVTTDLENCYRQVVRELELGGTFLNEFVNDEDSSPSNWRKSEILQMLMLQPKLAILDEIDLDQDERSLTLIANTLLSFMKEDEKSCIVITHNKSFLDLIKPTHVSILVDGKIVTQGGPDLYTRIEEDGYSQFS